MLTVVILLSMLFCSGVHTKIYKNCELANELVKKFGFSKDPGSLGNWICIAKHGSGFNTKAKEGPLLDGSYNYGIFQLNSKIWCGSSGSKNQCGIPCEALLNDDINNDVKCALNVYKLKGFAGWLSWTNNCKNRDVSKYVIPCEMHRRTYLNSIIKLYKKKPLKINRI
ncbi:lysozyme C-like [Limulus polyphemus]|uniref:lysozyme n=1 Tax=Limulus polyphemus TaxID=6850 RepID=A0ABM1SZG1_LIMPO|nr:lysozyme C-like [Limulus polyphemus]